MARFEASLSRVGAVFCALERDSLLDAAIGVTLVLRRIGAFVWLLR
jgi:hypothetical protein